MHVFCLSTNHFAIGLKVLESLLLISMITQVSHACGAGVVVNDHGIGNGISGSCPGIDDHSLNFKFSNKWSFEVPKHYFFINNFSIKNYFSSLAF